MDISQGLTVEATGELRAHLISQKPKDIVDPQALISNFHSLHHSLLAQEGLDKGRVLAVDTLTLLLLRITQYIRLHPEFVSAEILTQELTELFDFVTDYLQTGPGAFSNAITALLGRLLLFAKIWTAVDPKDLLKLWVSSVFKLPSTLKNLYFLVDTVARDFDLEYVLEDYAYFPAQCVSIMSTNALANSSSRAFTAIQMSTLKLFGTQQEWVKSWSPLVINGLSNNALRSNVITYLLPLLFKASPEIFGIFVKQMADSNSDEMTDILLGVLRVGQTTTNATDPVEDGIVSTNTLQRFLYHRNEQYRMNAFALVTSTVKKSRKIPDYIVCILLDSFILDTFFKEAGATETRVSFSSMLRRVLITMKETHGILTKKMTKAEEGIEEQLEVIESIYKSLFRYLLAQMVPDSSYQQLVLTFEMLQVFVEQELDGVSRSKSKKKAKATKVLDIYTEFLIEKLLRFTTSNYEDIRSKAASLLIGCPPELLSRFLLASPLQNLENSFELLHLVKGRKSDGGAELFLALAKFYQENNDYDNYFEIVNRLLTDMNKIISEKKSPHGHFTAFAMIFQATNSNVLSAQKAYFTSTFTLLMHTINIIWDMLKPNLVSAPSETDEDADSISWRVIRESTILLNTIVETNCNENWVFFDHSVFLKSCDLVMDQLANVTHRGAFSAVFPTYVRICEICFQTSELSRLPRQWLESNLELVETKAQYISRRSGGLPFLITGVLNAATPKDLPALMELTFSRLLLIASVEYIPNADEKMDIPQVHALNCMKHIFSDSDLSLGIRPHVNGALLLSLTNLTNATWAIKNAAVMLFTSLQGKLFTGSKLGDYLPTVNASTFFDTYSGIETILYDSLVLSLKGLDTNLIIPVLTVLERLESFSPNDNTLDRFVVLLKESFLCHKIWKVREMAAILISAMVHPTRLIEEANALLTFTQALTLKNAIHGYLLCVSEILKRFQRQDPGPIEEFQHCTLNEFAIMHERMHNWPILSIFLDIVIQVYGEEFTTPAVNLLASIVIKETEDSQTPAFPDGARQLFLASASTTLLECHLRKGEHEQLIDLSLLLLTQESFEVQLACLRFWKENHTKEMDTTLLSPRLFEIISDPQGWNHVKSVAIDLIGAMGLSLHHGLAEKSWSEEMKASSLVPYAEYLVESSNETDLNSFVDVVTAHLNDSQPEDVRLAAVRAADVYTKSRKETLQDAKAVFCLFKALFDDDSIVRMTAASAVSARLNMEKDINPAYVSLLFMTSFVAEFGTNTCSEIFFSEKLSIQTNLNDSISQMLSELFDIDRANLYRSEVQFHKLLVEDIAMTVELPNNGNFEEYEQNALSDLDSLLQFIGNHRYMLEMWSYDIHLDTAIQKASLYGKLRKHSTRIAEKVDKLIAVLADIGYHVARY